MNVFYCISSQLNLHTTVHICPLIFWRSRGSLASLAVLEQTTLLYVFMSWAGDLSGMSPCKRPMTDEGSSSRPLWSRAQEERVSTMDRWDKMYYQPKKKKKFCWAPNQKDCKWKKQLYNFYLHIIMFLVEFLFFNVCNVMFILHGIKPCLFRFLIIVKAKREWDGIKKVHWFFFFFFSITHAQLKLAWHAVQVWNIPPFVRVRRRFFLMSTTRGLHAPFLCAGLSRPSAPPLRSPRGPSFSSPFRRGAAPLRLLCWCGSDGLAALYLPPPSVCLSATCGSCSSRCSCCRWCWWRWCIGWDLDGIISLRPRIFFSFFPLFFFPLPTLLCCFLWSSAEVVTMPPRSLGNL